MSTCDGIRYNIKVFTLSYDTYLENRNKQVVEYSSILFSDKNVTIISDRKIKSESNKKKLRTQFL